MRQVSINPDHELSYQKMKVSITVNLRHLKSNIKIFLFEVKIIFNILDFKIFFNQMHIPELSLDQTFSAVQNKIFCQPTGPVS